MTSNKFRVIPRRLIQFVCDFFFLSLIHFSTLSSSLDTLVRWENILYFYNFLKSFSLYHKIFSSSIFNFFALVFSLFSINSRFFHYHHRFWEFVWREHTKNYWRKQKFTFRFLCLLAFYWIGLRQCEST